MICAFSYFIRQKYCSNNIDKTNICCSMHLFVISINKIIRMFCWILSIWNPEAYACEDAQFSDNLWKTILALSDGNDKNKPRIWNICKNESIIRLASIICVLVWLLCFISLVSFFIFFSFFLFCLTFDWKFVRLFLVIMWCTRVAKSIKAKTHTHTNSFES